MSLATHFYPDGERVRLSRAFEGLPLRVEADALNGTAAVDVVLEWGPLAILQQRRVPPCPSGV